MVKYLKNRKHETTKITKQVTNRETASLDYTYKKLVRLI